MAGRFRRTVRLDARDDVAVPMTHPAAGHYGRLQAPERVPVDVAPAKRLAIRDILFALAVAGAAAWLRHRQLDPKSLWVDDAWPALVTKVSWAHVPEVGLTAPGFAAILKAWLHVTGFSEVKAQSVAFTFGIAGPVLVWLLCLARGLSRSAAAFATAILVTSPAVVVYSAHVKQYTLDLVLVVVLIWLGWRLIDAPQIERRWLELTIAAIVATAISSAVVAVVCGGYLAALLAARRAGRSVVWMGARYLGAFALFAAAWWVTMLRPRLGSALHEYWRSFYFQTNSVGAFFRSVSYTPTRFFRGFADIPGLLMLVLVVAAAVVCWKANRDLAVLLLTPLFVAVVFALVQLAPLGTGRTDLYLYPVVAVLLAVGASELVRRFNLPALLAVIVLIAAIAVSARAPDNYPREDMKKAMRTLVAKAAPDDAIMVYYGGRYAFALYTKWPVSVYPTNRQTAGFDVRIHHPHTILLPGFSDRALYPATIKRLSAHYKRLWFIGVHGHDDVVNIEDALVGAGFDTHFRYYKGPRVFLSRWMRS